MSAFPGRSKFQSPKSAVSFPRKKSGYKWGIRRNPTFSFPSSTSSGEGFFLSPSLAPQHADMPHPELHWGFTRRNSHRLQHPETRIRGRVSLCPASSCPGGATSITRDRSLPPKAPRSQWQMLPTHAQGLFWAMKKLAGRGIPYSWLCSTALLWAKIAWLRYNYQHFPLFSANPEQGRETQETFDMTLTCIHQCKNTIQLRGLKH